VGPGAAALPRARHAAPGALGATTAHAAETAGLHVDRVAERTDLRSVVEAVAAALEVAA
jgi:uroporphyrinogen-III synthase